MRSQWIRFEEVSVKRTRFYTDYSGKKRQKTRKFFQTINPFNQKDGRQKTRQEIMEEITSEADAWMNLSISEVIKGN